MKTIGEIMSKLRAQRSKKRKRTREERGLHPLSPESIRSTELREAFKRRGRFIEYEVEPRVISDRERLDNMIGVPRRKPRGRMPRDGGTPWTKKDKGSVRAVNRRRNKAARVARRRNRGAR